MSTKQAEYEGTENRPMGRSGEKREEKEMGVKGLKILGGDEIRKKVPSDQIIASDPFNLSLKSTYPTLVNGSDKGVKAGAGSRAGEGGEEELGVEVRVDDEEKVETRPPVGIFFSEKSWELEEDVKEGKESSEKIPRSLARPHESEGGTKDVIGAQKIKIAKSRKNS